MSDPLADPAQPDPLHEWRDWSTARIEEVLRDLIVSPGWRYLAEYIREDSLRVALTLANPHLSREAVDLMRGGISRDAHFVGLPRQILTEIENERAMRTAQATPLDE